MKKPVCPVCKSSLRVTLSEVKAEASLFLTPDLILANVTINPETFNGMNISCLEDDKHLDTLPVREKVKLFTQIREYIKDNMNDENMTLEW